MAIDRGYQTLQQVKGWIGLTDSVQDSNIEMAIEGASRAMDNHCNRCFFYEEEESSKIYRAKNPQFITVDDIGSSTDLVIKTDEDGDGVFETTWSASDYQLEPFNYEGRAITSILALERSFPIYTNGRAAVQVTAHWGWAQVPMEVQLATRIYAIRLFNRKDSPEGILSYGEAGAIRLGADDKDVAKLLARYQRASFA